METEILLEVKPKFISWVINIGSWGMAMLSVLIFGFCFAPLAALLAETSDITLPMAFLVYFLILVILSGIFVEIRAFILRKNYEVTNYKVYNDRIEFEEGFINHKYTTIRMVDIKEIHLDQNFIQRQAELGTIRFITAANNSTASTGVCFKDIQNSMAVYAKIKQVHENN